MALLYGSALVASVLLGTLLGDRFWWTFLLNTFALYLFVPLPVIMLLAVLSRNVLACVPCGAAVLLWAYIYGGLFLPRGGVVPGRHIALTVMTFNVLEHNEHPERVVAALRASGADLIGLQELNHAVARAIQRDLHHLYPYQVLAPHTASSAGMGLISRYPLQPILDHLAGTWFGPPQIVSLDLRGVRVIVLNVHQVSNTLKRRALEREARQREVTARAIVAYVRAHPGPLVVTGDFNVGDRSTPYRIVTQVLGDSWREAGWGFGHTFPGAMSPGSSRPTIYGVPVPMWLVRIDYVFHSREWTVQWARIGPWDGVSDHRPVLVRLALNR